MKGQGIQPSSLMPRQIFRALGHGKRKCSDDPANGNTNQPMIRRTPIMNPTKDLKIITNNTRKLIPGTARLVTAILVFFLIFGINTVWSGQDLKIPGSQGKSTLSPNTTQTTATAMESTVTLDQITVVSKKNDDYIQKNPNQVVSMDETEITQRNFLEVYEALGSMSGVDVRRGSSGMGARISIRGGGGSGSVLVAPGRQTHEQRPIQWGGPWQYPHGYHQKNHRVQATGAGVAGPGQQCRCHLH